MDGSWCGLCQSMHTMGALTLTGYTPLPASKPVKKKATSAWARRLALLCVAAGIVIGGCHGGLGAWPSSVLLWGWDACSLTRGGSAGIPDGAEAPGTTTAHDSGTGPGPVHERRHRHQLLWWWGGLWRTAPRPATYLSERDSIRCGAATLWNATYHRFRPGPCPCV